ncbi:MAG TPA: DoxX family protein, partial [Opitutales bacterium]|nr:DoxX family protein [Opitutales bacterium]
GALMFSHGLQKFIGGMQEWEMIGSVMANYGITVYPTAWGILCMSAEAIGGILFLLGLFFRPVCFILLFNMLMALSYHYFSADTFQHAELTMIYGIVFLSFLFIGPGRYSVDNRVC